MSNTAPKITTPSSREAVRIDAGIVDDPDAFERDEQWFDDTQLTQLPLPHMLEPPKRSRGKQKAPRKQDIHIRLDTDVIEYFKRGGRGWQTRINDSLREIVDVECTKAEQGAQT